jgi:adenylate cyclase
MPLPRLSNPLRVIVIATLAAGVVGAAYSEMQVLERGERALAVHGMARGAATGATIAFVLTCLDGLVLPGSVGAPLRRASFGVNVVVKTAIYVCVIVFGLKFADVLFPPPGKGGVQTGDVLFSLGVAFVFVFILDLNTLLGQGVLLNFVTGRYHQPRLETRIFLFLDMAGSTGWAERLGPLGFHRLLNRFVLDVTEPIVSAGGEIHRYVGDEVIATWRLDEGVARGQCVAATFAALDRLTRRAPDYTREFGAPVAVRAGLHCGPVVTGEMGSVKREIVFLGDTVNTAARIQDLCRQTGDRVIASADLINRLELPSGVAKRSLGDLRLRGKGADLALYALTMARPHPRRAQAKDREIAPERTPSTLS